MKKNLTPREFGVINDYLRHGATYRSISRENLEKSTVGRILQLCLASDEVPDVIKNQIRAHIKHNLAVRHIHGGMATATKWATELNGELLEQLTGLDPDYVGTCIAKFLGGKK